MRAAWLLAALLGTQTVPAREPLQLAWLREGRATLATLDERGVQDERPLPPGLRTPLGSLWKLFVHAYEVDSARAEVPYRCAGQDREEAYCCERGASIGRDRALVQSCGLYFAPRRLGIDARDWRAYWQARGAPAWLQDLAALQPQAEVPVSELLAALVQLPAQQEIRRVLLDVVLEARDDGVASKLGSQWRVKTWSWHRAGNEDARIGGFAGWRLDGTPVWASGEGTSQQVLAAHAATLATLPAVASAPRADVGDCVDVRLFARYPVARVEARQASRSRDASRGIRQAHPERVGKDSEEQQAQTQLVRLERVLRGDYLVTFENGNTIDLQSAGEVLFDGERLFARLPREEYVARVLDREAAAEPVQAARALAVAIRSYLQQNARRGGHCLAIDDSSATQRVAPRPASAAARAVAAFSADIVMSGAAVQYHRDRPAPGTLSWQDAVAQARTGSDWRKLLSATWPRAALARWDNPVQACRPLPAARDWLLARLAGWRPRLDREIGYAETRDFEVCMLAGGRPHVERAQRRIHVRALSSQQDRLDLVHEYLHLAFEAHPNGQDETYVEALARRLLLE